MSFLMDILEATRQAIDARERELPLDKLKAEVEPRRNDRRFLRSLRPDGLVGQDQLAVIAEFKRSAPSSSWMHLEASVRDYVETYVREGASALSILTEGTQFRGSLEDLRDARKAVDLPILRKDFVIDERQIYEAVDAGADAILLIAAILDDPKLHELHGLARRLGLDVLVEIREEKELDRALLIDADLIGINNRNLATFEVDVETTRRLVSRMPSQVTVVSESGLTTRSQLDGLASIGVHAALIGSALMNSADVASSCEAFTRPRSDNEPSRSADQPAFA